VKQIANVASLPGIVGHSLGMPDIHSGSVFELDTQIIYFADPFDCTDLFIDMDFLLEMLLLLI
jgi:hypothetical protein